MKRLWTQKKPIIGMVHLAPLPGTPLQMQSQHSLEFTQAKARQDTLALLAGGVDAICLENFYDVPFHKSGVEPHIVAAMTSIITQLRDILTVPFGINVLRNDALAALAIASVTGADFIRVNVLSGVYITDQGMIEGNAATVLRYRQIICPNVAILADVQVKHAAPLGERDLVQEAKDLIFRGLADVLIVTGKGTGSQPDLMNLKRLRQSLPESKLLAGSGITQNNIHEYYPCCDGFIIGTEFKNGSSFHASVETPRVAAVVNTLQTLRS
jgi:membrane complex biogenesis BtpA family protein